MVAYNLVEGTPFSVNLTGLVTDGEDAHLAVRITSPGGWWSWEDCNVQQWGKVKVPLSRGFSGITGPVKLLVLNPVHIEDIYVQNTPAMHDVNIHVTMRNDGAKPVRGDLNLDLPGLASQSLNGVLIPPGEASRSPGFPSRRPGSGTWTIQSCMNATRH